MTDYNFVPGFPGIGDSVGGSDYSPAGPEFASEWLNPIMKSGAATHWTILSSNLTATVAEHGRAFKLSGFTLAMNAAADLQQGWRAIVVGPGTIDPQDGPTQVIAEFEWAILGSDGTTTTILRSGAGGQYSLDLTGPWDSEVGYTIMQAVSHEGGSYLSREDGNVGNEPAGVTDDHWMVLAVPPIPEVDSVNGQTGDVVLDGTDLVFDPTGTDLLATDVDEAIRELDANVADKLDDSQLDDDVTLGGGGASATKIPSQHAVKVYADQLLSAANAVVLIGTIDASANPDYPAGDKGHQYVITVAGKIGGASGVSVEPGDTIMCLVDGTVTGDQSTVGANWTIIQANLVNAVLGPVSSTTDNVAAFTDSSGRTIKDTGIAYQDLAVLDDLLLRKGEVVFTGTASVDADDIGKLHVYNGASDGAVSLPAAATAGDGAAVLLSVTGEGDATLQVTGGAAFDNGETEILLETGQSLLALSNGTTWRLLLRGGGGGSSSGGVVMREEIFTSAGETTKTLADQPVGEEYVWFTYGPLSQNKDTFSLSGKTLTFTAIPTGQEYTVKYMVFIAQVAGDEVWGEDLGTGTTMTLSEAPATFNALTVMVGLIELPKDGVAYTLSGTTVTLAEYNTSMGRRTYKIAKALPIAVPAADSVASTSIQTDAVTLPKLADTARAPIPYNLTLVGSNNGTALTIAVKTLAGTDPSATDSVAIPYRSATGGITWREITSALSLTLTSGSTLGFTSGVAGRLWVVMFDDAGTQRLAVKNCSSSSRIYPLNEGVSDSANAEGGAGGADNTGTFFANAAITSKRFSILGYMDFSLATAGTWNENPDSTVLFGPGIKRPGEVVQMLTMSTTTETNTSSTTPQPTALTLNIIPTSAANIISILGVGGLQTANGASSANAQMYRDFTVACSNTLQMYPQNFYGSGLTMMGFDKPNQAVSTNYTAHLWSTGGTSVDFLPDGVGGQQGILTLTELQG